MGAIAFQWHTKVNYLTDVPIMYLVGMLPSTRRAFSKISSRATSEIVREELELPRSARLDAERARG